MTRDRDMKRAIRARMKVTRERYTVARSALVASDAAGGSTSETSSSQGGTMPRVGAGLLVELEERGFAVLRSFATPDEVTRMTAHVEEVVARTLADKQEKDRQRRAAGETGWVRVWDEGMEGVIWELLTGRPEIGWLLSVFRRRALARRAGCSVAASRRFATDSAMKPQGPVFDRVWRRSCQVAPVNKKQIGDLIQQHYLHQWPKQIQLAFGLKRRGKLMGIITYSALIGETRERFGGDVWELSRLIILDRVPANAESFFIAVTIRHIKQHYGTVNRLVSFADPAHGHTGIVYRASNWTQVAHSSKHLFVYELGRASPLADSASTRQPPTRSRRGSAPVAGTDECDHASGPSPQRRDGDRR
jgi:hypothetical protein